MNNFCSLSWENQLWQGEGKMTRTAQSLLFFGTGAFYWSARILTTTQTVFHPYKVYYSLIYKSSSGDFPFFLKNNYRRHGGGKKERSSFTAICERSIAPI